jgi:hypothetical protein
LTVVAAVTLSFTFVSQSAPARGGRRQTVGSDEFMVLRESGTWFCFDGRYRYAHPTAAQALEYAVRQALQSDALGRDAKVITQDDQGVEQVVWWSGQ